MIDLSYWFGSSLTAIVHTFTCCLLRSSWAPGGQGFCLSISVSSEILTSELNQIKHSPRCYLVLIENIVGFLGGSDSKESACNVEDLGLIPELERSSGGRHGNLFQYSCLENPDGQRSLAGYSPWVCKESDMTERLSLNKFNNL